jgi:DNA mismatch repair protein MutS
MKDTMTPMMKHYLLMKENYPDCILFYRLGDFYEMFFDDAVTVSRTLELTLTGKDCGMEERAPMCGVPFHSAKVYIARLISRGFKVAICEQMEDPKQAKGIVKRDVVRVITPGTVVDETMLDEKANNYLAAVLCTQEGAGVAFCDVSTGELYTTQTAKGDLDAVINELARYAPAEVMLNDMAKEQLDEVFTTRIPAVRQAYDKSYFEQPEAVILEHFKKQSLGDLRLGEVPLAAGAVGAMLRYLEQTQKSSLSYIDTVNVYGQNQYMDIDMATRRNLEITETMRDKAKRGTLLWVLDRTKTSMGARMLKQWLEKPLVDAQQIERRLESVEELTNNLMLRDDLGAVLSKIYDIARILGRISLGTANPKDMLSLRNSLTKLPELEYVLHSCKSQMLSSIVKNMDIMADVRELLEGAIHDDAPAVLKDGGIIKDGYHEEVDKLRRAKNEGRGWISNIEREEKEKTGIKNLKIGYNKVFGYYLEVTKSYLDQVPDYYIRKQTLTNCERFITPELKEIEYQVLGASDRLILLETELFEQVRAAVAAESERLRRVCDAVSTVDVLYSLAEAAEKQGYQKPEISGDGVIEITNGRHPVVEKMLSGELFVPNDTHLERADSGMIIITGPNMAGKSTYMRQVALIVLMAQIGSFVPAAEAKIAVVDKIFTRVGASDDISSGQSTFMLEMTEVANILDNATEKSLVILDEIGRGTSTYDGLSIAWAVVEYIQENIGAKTLFATHYHELTQLEDKLAGVKNYRIAVKKRGDDITFLRKIVRGGADDSYGIEVAALAGVPDGVIQGAKKILGSIENGTLECGQHQTVRKEEAVPDEEKRLLFQEIAQIDATTYTPIEALNKLYELTNKAKELCGEERK